MSSATGFGVSCFLRAIILWNFATAAGQASEENRPYEFAFNIVDFQHRFEKKDSDGIITGEYGFITADGVYRETGYATDKNGDFIITRMSYRRIKSLKDAQEIFKDRPEAARKLVEAIARACSACKVATKAENATRSASTVTASNSQTNLSPVLKEMAKTLTEKKKDDASPGKVNEIPEDSKDLSNQRRGKSLSEEIPVNAIDSKRNFTKKNEATNTDVGDAKANDRKVEKMPNDLYYRFNYTITSHGHQEDGYRSGAKDGSYRAQSENGVDTRVKYLSNEFGHQPNVSFVPNANAANESQRLKGNSFHWYWS